MLHCCGGPVLHSVRRLCIRKDFAAILRPLGIIELPFLAITDSRWQPQPWDTARQCRRSVVTHSTEQTENFLVVHPRQRSLEHQHETLKLVETLTGGYSCQPLRSASFAASFSGAKCILGHMLLRCHPSGSSCRHLVLGRGSQKKVSSATYIGPGAVKKVAATCQEMGDITR